MFQIDGKFLPIDTPFEHAEIQYPPNWLRLSTAADRKRLGIKEVPDPVPHDDRFYWAPGVPKDLAQLKTAMLAQVKDTARSLLQPTDWKVVRAAEGLKPVPQDTVALRQAIRAAADANEAAIDACATVEDLAALQLSWPDPSNIPAVVPPAVSRFQARAALLAAGLLDGVEALMADPQTPAVARLAWKDAQEFKRSSPTIAALAGALNLTDAQLDDLFTAAAAIDA